MVMSRCTHDGDLDDGALSPAMMVDARRSGGNVTSVVSLTGDSNARAVTLYADTLAVGHRCSPGSGDRLHGRDVVELGAHHGGSTRRSE